MNSNDKIQIIIILTVIAFAAIVLSFLVENNITSRLCIENNLMIVNFDGVTYECYDMKTSKLYKADVESKWKLYEYGTFSGVE